MLPTNIEGWIAIGGALFGVLNTVWIWLSRPARDLGSRVDKLETELETTDVKVLEELKKHDRRIQRVEDEIRHLPTKSDLHEVATAVATIKTELGGMSKVVNRIDTYLRESR